MIRRSAFRVITCRPIVSDMPIVRTLFDDSAIDSEYLELMSRTANHLMPFLCRWYAVDTPFIRVSHREAD